MPRFRRGAGHTVFLAADTRTSGTLAM